MNIPLAYFYKQDNLRRYAKEDFRWYHDPTVSLFNSNFRVIRLLDGETLEGDWTPQRDTAMYTIKKHDCVNSILKPQSTRVYNNKVVYPSNISHFFEQKMHKYDKLTRIVNDNNKLCKSIVQISKPKTQALPPVSLPHSETNITSVGSIESGEKPKATENITQQSSVNDTETVKQSTQKIVVKNNTTITKPIVQNQTPKPNQTSDELKYTGMLLPKDKKLTSRPFFSATKKGLISIINNPKSSLANANAAAKEWMLRDKYKGFHPIFFNKGSLEKLLNKNIPVKIYNPDTKKGSLLRDRAQMVQGDIAFVQQYHPLYNDLKKQFSFDTDNAIPLKFLMNYACKIYGGQPAKTSSKKFFFYSNSSESRPNHLTLYDYSGNKIKLLPYDSEQQPQKGSFSKSVKMGTKYYLDNPEDVLVVYNKEALINLPLKKKNGTTAYAVYRQKNGDFSTIKRNFKTLAQKAGCL